MCSLFLVLRLLITTAVRFIKENHQRLLLWEVSVVQQRRSGLREVIMDDVQQLKNSSLTLHPLDTCNAQIAIADMVAQ